MRPRSRLASCSMRRACAFWRPPRAGLARTIAIWSYCRDAWRVGETISDLLAATWVCTQPASEAAPRITASRCATRREPEPELKAARMPMRPALISTYEVLAQLLENISSPACRIRHARVAIQSGRNEVRRALSRHHSRDFMSVLSLSHIRRLKPMIVPPTSAHWNPHRCANCCFGTVKSWNRQPRSSGEISSALAMLPAPVRWHRAISTPLASHASPLRVRFRGAARQNRRRGRRVPARPRL